MEILKRRGVDGIFTDNADLWNAVPEKKIS
jgi:glycerophosphoryl diester phosphodiesterase